MVAVQSPDVAFIVLMAGTGIPGDEILILQGQALLKAEGADEKKLNWQRQVQSRILAVAKQEKDNTVAEKKIKDIFQEETAKLPEEEKKELEKVKSMAEGQLKMVLSPWFRYFLSYDPRPTLMKVKCPVLAINGEKDVQVIAKINLDAIAKALKEGGNQEVTTKEFLNLNHLFQTCKTGTVGEYGKIEETISPAVLELMGDWILRHTGNRNTARDK